MSTTSGAPAPSAGAAPSPAAGGTQALEALCRLTFRTPGRSLELAVPVDVPVAELLPTVLELGSVGDTGGLAELGLAHDGWVLQRLGGEPLDLDATIGRLDLLDGDVLHLRPRSATLPPVDFDDLVEGVADGIRAATPPWTAAATRVTLLVLMGVALAGGLLALGLPGQSVVRAATAGFAGLLLLGAALSAAQAVGDRTIGALFGLGGVCYLAASGALVVGGSDPAGPRLVAGGAAALAASALATAAIAWAPPFLTTGLLGLLTALGGVIILLGGDAQGLAAVATVVALVLGQFAPPIAFRFAGLRLPQLPTTAGQLQEDIDPHPAEQVAARSRAAAIMLDAVAVGSGLALVAALALLGLDREWPGWTLCLVVSVLLLVHQRGFTDAVVRGAAIVPAVGGVAVLAAHLALSLQGASRVAVAVAAVLVAVAVAVAAATMPQRRVLPYWGRAADIAHTLSAVAVLPLAALVLGVYSALRGAGA